MHTATTALVPTAGPDQRDNRGSQQLGKIRLSFAGYNSVLYNTPLSGWGRAFGRCSSDVPARSVTSRPQVPRSLKLLLQRRDGLLQLLDASECVVETPGECRGVVEGRDRRVIGDEDALTGLTGQQPFGAENLHGPTRRTRT